MKRANRASCAFAKTCARVAQLAQILRWTKSVPLRMTS
jgi:hypothetical protein